MSKHHYTVISKGCSVMRRMLVKHSTVNMVTGESKETSQEWVTKPCGTPLVQEQERVTLVCSSCASGWTHPHNFRHEEWQP